MEDKKPSNAGRKPIYTQERTRLNLHIEKELLEKIKKLCATKEITVNSYVISLLQERVEYDYFKVMKETKES